VREIDFVLPCANFSSGVRDLLSFLLVLMRRLGLIFMDVILTRFQGSDGCPIPVERFTPDRVRQTLRGIVIPVTRRD
jgi:hypothetical protein